MNRARLLCGVLLALPFLMGGGCSPGSTGDGGEQQGNDLDKMDTAAMSVGDTDFHVWLAQTDDQRNNGLMFVQADEMQSLEDGSERGMLFVFDNEQVLNFWMKDTIIPLDIAYARSDGTIVKIYTMTPLDLSIYSSIKSARYALEVNAGVFSSKGIKEGDVMTLPEVVLDSGG